MHHYTASLHCITTLYAYLYLCLLSFSLYGFVWFVFCITFIWSHPAGVCILVSIVWTQINNFQWCGGDPSIRSSVPLGCFSFIIGTQSLKGQSCLYISFVLLASQLSNSGIKHSMVFVLCVILRGQFGEIWNFLWNESDFCLEAFVIFMSDVDWLKQPWISP